MVEPPVLVLDDVHVRYRVRKESQRPKIRDVFTGRTSQAVVVDALQGVDLVLHEGEALGVVGRNGSGKSTLLKTMAGLLNPWQGVVLGAHRPTLLGVSAAFDQSLSGRTNVILGGTALGMRRSDVMARYEEIVDFAELGEFIDLPLRSYSSGMAARLQFAVATAMSPEILLIDEALAVGDFGFQIKSERRMKQMLDGAGSVVLVSHSTNSVKRMCRRTVWIDKGRVRAIGPTEEIIEAYEGTQEDPPTAA